MYMNLDRIIIIEGVSIRIIHHLVSIICWDPTVTKMVTGQVSNDIIGLVSVQG